MRLAMTAATQRICSAAIQHVHRKRRADACRPVSRGLLQVACSVAAQQQNARVHLHCKPTVAKTLHVVRDGARKQIAPAISTPSNQAAVCVFVRMPHGPLNVGRTQRSQW
ncbi:hypothetical protein [Xanthomonas nasturtii]|uniref:hypothetical protein n=1 Tax=Xanthomonas nasturtii TaxID=1843581 RepID=UPI00128FF932|nr:hypothetical protein [Xanthomonas nasturtii]